MADDKFGFLDPNVPRELTAPEGYEAVHKPGMSWARQGDRKENTSWLTAAQYNHIVAQFRGLATLAGVDVSDLLASSPLLLRTFVQRTIEAVLSGTDLDDGYKVMRKADYDTDEDGKVDLAAGGTGVSATSAADLRGKLGITAAIDTAIQALGAVVVNKGSWNPSAGSFPGGGAAKNGWAYIVTADGTVGGVDFRTGDRVLALADNASTSTYAGNWLKLDYTDQVLSVAGLTGAISHTALEAALTGLMPTAGGTFSGNVYISKGNPTLNLTKPGLDNNNIIMGRNAGNARWSLFLADTSDNFRLRAHRDDGTVRDDPVGIDRLGGQISINRGIVLGDAEGGDPGNGKINAVDYQINGESVADALTARAKLADLASTDNGKGAAMVGVKAIASLAGVTTVQEALEALAESVVGQGPVKAWASFDGTQNPPVVRSSGNIASITKDSTGKYTITFAQEMADANYAVIGAATGVNDGYLVSIMYGSTPTKSSVQIMVKHRGADFTDCSLVSVSILGN